MLTPDDFAGFFREVHGRGEPFPWQERLVRLLADRGEWPSTLDLPTGTGKTAAIDIAIFHLALDAANSPRHAPVRVAFVVDRRLVVDDAFRRAKKIARALAQPTGAATSRVANALKTVAGDGPPLVARRLRGGVPREDDWARTPFQPTVLCSTVDQVGSRLLFRGFGISDSMKPVHAGLLGSDCLILLDEVHLAEPFRQTLAWVKHYHSNRWCSEGSGAPWQVASLSATPRPEPTGGVERRKASDQVTLPAHGPTIPFGLEQSDRDHPLLKRRLQAPKPARLVLIPRKGAGNGDASGGTDGGEEYQDQGRRAAAVAAEVKAALEHFADPTNGASAPAVGVVVNRVGRARAVFEALKKELEERTNERGLDLVLLIGPGRPVARDEIVERSLAPIRTAGTPDGSDRSDRALVVVATQCLEAGVDIDLDGLITEAAPIDALRQRFGRLNRAGRSVAPHAAILADKSDLAARSDDPVYGGAIRAAWDYLAGVADVDVSGVPVVDFGITAFDALSERSPVPPEALSEKLNAPILLPAHLELLSRTSPPPQPDPDIGLFLHGPQRQPDAVSVIWRGDVTDDGSSTDADERVRRILLLMPPRATEAIELPVWAVRRRFSQRPGQGGSMRLSSPGPLADIATRPDESDDERSNQGARVFRWRGDDEASKWILVMEIRPGDTIVVPSAYGGCDEFGWNPAWSATVSDRAREAARPFVARRFAVRVAPGLLKPDVAEASTAAPLDAVSSREDAGRDAHVAEALAAALAVAVSPRWTDLRDAIADIGLPEDIRHDLGRLDQARRGVVAYTDVYGTDDRGRPRGVIFHVPRGIRVSSENQEEEGQSATEDDESGSLPGFPLALSQHTKDVEAKAQIFASGAALPPPRVRDVILAARHHDDGKVDHRFQSWLHYGDPLGYDPRDILAKSGRRLPRHARTASELPDRWRHEAQSVRLARLDMAVAEADDPDLVLWLIGTHHGHGRPLFPHRDPEETAPQVGPQSLAFDWNGLDWPALFERLIARYGPWELARMEAVLRLADHRASEEGGRK